MYLESIYNEYKRESFQDGECGARLGDG